MDIGNLQYYINNTARIKIAGRMAMGYGVRRVW